jgi:hypothetical protein
VSSAQRPITVGMKVRMRAILIVALIVLAVIGAGWKWGGPGVPKAVGWTWDSAAVDDGHSSVPDGWTRQ